MTSRLCDAIRHVWMLQAAYNTITGIWPLIGMRSFQWITGPKTDLWLVRCVGGLVTVIGIVLGMAGRRGRVTPEITALAVGSSASLAAIDVIYSSRGRISRIYLLDAIINVLFIGAWISRIRAGTRRTTAWS
ncbi:MAG: hypothetical protein WBA63_04060 [Thermomicrobiales bacterium]